MPTDEVPTLKLSEAARLCGIEAGILRHLIEDGLLQGAVRTKNGHVYLREDAVPTWHEAVALVEQQFVAHLHRAKGALSRVRVEIEAVSNDIESALEDPLAELGDDLVGLKTYSSGHDQTSLTSALSRLNHEVWAVRGYSDALRRARVVP